MSVLRVITQRLNPYSQKVGISLDIKKLDFEYFYVDDPAEVRRYSPVAGTLPVLEDGQKRIADSTKILRYIEERYPEPPIWNRDPKIASAQQQLMEWSDASFLFYWDRWRAARYPRPGDDQPANPSLLSHLKRRIDRSFGRKGVDPTPLQLRELQVLDELANRMDDLVGMLGQRPYFHADEPSVADASVFGMLRVIRDGPMMNGAQMVKRRPPLARYMKRMEAISSSSLSGDLSSLAP